MTNINNNSSHPFRRLIIFQLKLAVDALRDILLSPVSIICSLLDLVQNKQGENSYFEKLMSFGRATESRINLFEQHQADSTIDSVLGQVESLFRKEYQDKELSKKTLSAIEKLLQKGVTKE